MDSVVVLRGAANAENAKLFQNFVMAPEYAALISAFAGHANGNDGSEPFLTDDMKDASEIVAPPEAGEAGDFLPASPVRVPGRAHPTPLSRPRGGRTAWSR